MREFAVLIALGVALCHQISQLVLRQRNINSDKSTSFTSSKQTQISTNPEQYKHSHKNPDLPEITTENPPT
jgi:hypothetical protein